MHISTGLDIPIKGSPRHVVDQLKPVSSYALLARDYHGMRPTMHVRVGDEVKLGDILFEDKKQPGVSFVSPASGKVTAIHRGERRTFLSCVIKSSAKHLEDDDGLSKKAFFTPIDPGTLASLSSADIRRRLLDSGLWTAIRRRPFSKTPAVDEQPRAVFVSTVDSRPLAFNPQIVIAEHSEAFDAGLGVLHGLTGKDIYLNTAPNQSVPNKPFIHHEEWQGKHPCGLVGTHMHMLLPVSLTHVNWHVGYQDVIAMGYLFIKGCHWLDRYVALCGPVVDNPRIIKTRLGACLSELVGQEHINLKGLTTAPYDQLSPTENKKNRIRVISGSVLGGHTAREAHDYLSRFDYQVTLLAEGHERDFFLTKGWLSPGFHKFSLLGTYLGKFVPGYLFPMTTSTQGSKRAMVPIGLYEKVMPLDILATYLLRALIAKDTQRAQELGALELDEEDLALATFVCAGKYEYGPILRDNLTDIEKNG
ncbi:MAG: Na(+)-translocating NADH-quinone reductase subunit A [Proteobacteria bacterium]|nr:Na(+)-translocating NADH-quinone reductase subunit A [Pseudomonadota bacterium]